MPERTLRRTLFVLLVLLVPISYASMRFDPFQIDGDAVAYMDLADLLRTHHFAQAVNGYWHPLYPACLAFAQMLLHPTRMTELGAFYTINWFIFALEIAAILFFASAVTRLRQRMMATPGGGSLAEPGQASADYALSPTAVRLLGVALVVIAAERELTLGKVRPDALLQALLLCAVGALLRAMVCEGFSTALLAAAGAGIAFGLAYLTKSFAFVFALVSIAGFVVFAWRARRMTLVRSLALGFACVVPFALIAGPYVAALSQQKHRLNFGDSGNLNYAWYVGHTEKTHLEQSMTSSFGSATVHLTHPEKQLLASPGVYSYADFPVGTYPPWFDATYFNDGVKPRVRLGDLARRDVRNLQLAVRYVVNHPEPLMLLIVLWMLGARLRPHREGEAQRCMFAVLPIALGLALWALYGLVNIEERYVTVGYLLVLLPLFAALTTRVQYAPAVADAPERTPSEVRPAIRLAAGCVVLLAFLAVSSMAAIAAENHRTLSLERLPHAWSDPLTLGAAAALRQAGYSEGTRAACIGTLACLNDIEWARASGTRVLWEIYMPRPEDLMARLNALPNRPEVYALLRSQGAQLIVGHFDPGDMDPEIYPAAAGWKRLGKTEMYALPLH